MIHFAGDEFVTLNLLEKYPENSDIQKEVAEKLEEKLKSNSDFANVLNDLLKQIPGVQIKQNAISRNGNNNVAN